MLHAHSGMSLGTSLVDADDEMLMCGAVSTTGTPDPRTPEPRTPVTEPLSCCTPEHRSSLLGTPDRPTHDVPFQDGLMSPRKRPPMSFDGHGAGKRGISECYGDDWGGGGLCMTDGDDETTLSDDAFSEGVSRYAMDFIEKGILGKGSFGVVYKAQHRLDRKLYAVKMSLKPCHSHVSQENSLQEVYSLAALPRCPHRVTYHDCWIENNYLCIRFEFCEGGNIADVPVDSWQYSDILEVFYQMAIGLQSLHSHSVVHLDVKAENIYITYQGTKKIYKLGDFGLARKVNAAGQPTFWHGANEDEGDSRYLCQSFLNDRKEPKAADIFSLAATVYELARRKPLPKNGNEWQELRDHPAVDIEGVYDPRFVQLLKDCMDPVPTKRPSCMDILGHPVFEGIKRQSSQYDGVRALERRLAELRRLRGIETPGSSSTPGLSDSQSPDHADGQGRHIAAVEPPYTP